MKNTSEFIKKFGKSDEWWEPDYTAHFEPTDAPAGSAEKIEILRKRVELGLPLWHPDDRNDFDGLTGAIPPKNR